MSYYKLEKLFRIGASVWNNVRLKENLRIDWACNTSGTCSRAWASPFPEPSSDFCPAVNSGEEYTVVDTLSALTTSRYWGYLHLKGGREEGSGACTGAAGVRGLRWSQSLPELQGHGRDDSRGLGGNIPAPQRGERAPPRAPRLEPFPHVVYKLEFTSLNSAGYWTEVNHIPVFQPKLL